MRILLVVYDNDSYIHWFPQGLAYIAAVLKQEGYEVEIYNQDVHHYPNEHLTSYLDRNKFDIIGVSIIAGYYQYKKLLEISRAIEKSNQRPEHFILGGHGPSPEPEYFLGKTNADIVVMGEGENTVLELFDTLANHGSLKDVKGIAYRNGTQVVVNPRRDLIKDIDAIPWPAYDLFPIEYYRLLRMPHCSSSDFVMPLLSGRGCTFKCNFCYRMDKGFRPRSAEAIIEEIQYLQQDFAISYIAFSDELLMSSKQRTVEICEAFLRAGLKIKWDCNGRLNYATSDILSIMKKAGCVFINYGIEAYDNEVLKKMNKALVIKQIDRGIDATLSAGISPGLNMLFGHIGDNKQTLSAAVKFLIKHDDGAQMRTIRPVTPYPGSPLYYYAIEKGMIKGVDDFYENKHLNADLFAVNFTKLSEEELYSELAYANIMLVENYFENKKKRMVSQIKDLYYSRDTSFRGFRQS
ncbi:B12-binding domain-containing radical SAM protein [Desulfobacula toluolica]|uniref:Cobalamin-binding radical SAM protein n=1 Tax=Desulfobacula toluolica (strain DSM 7467 / Tol2) TaxID=651182 RepID=K0NLT8_DESTT|nr:radical SAM protein [Desulfobacula toluolica]CCK81700.1 cobalamin-binding radical SAM protein [Desulfobacula toluolica Tol2]